MRRAPFVLASRAKLYGSSLARTTLLDCVARRRFCAACFASGVDAQLLTGTTRRVCLNAEDARAWMDTKADAQRTRWVD
jgi:hypothetical protein